MSFLDVFVRGDFIDPSTLVGAAFYACFFILVAWFLARTIKLGVRRAGALLKDEAASTLLIRLGQVVVYTLAVFSIFYDSATALRRHGLARQCRGDVDSLWVGRADDAQ